VGTNVVRGSPPTVDFGRNLNDGRIEAAIGWNGFGPLRAKLPLGHQHTYQLFKRCAETNLGDPVESAKHEQPRQKVITYTRARADIAQW
jgi:hypothetical protein